MPDAPCSFIGEFKGKIVNRIKHCQILDRMMQGLFKVFLRQTGKWEICAIPKESTI